MASNRSKSPAKAQTRPALTFDIAVQLCPHQGMADKVAETFGLIVPEYDAIREQHARALRSMWTAFGESLNEKATEMHFQRIVGSLVASAVGAGRFFSTKVSEARAAAARAADGGETRNTDRPGEQGAADPGIRGRHDDAGLRPARRRPRRGRSLPGNHRRRLEGLRGSSRDWRRREAGELGSAGRLRRIKPDWRGSRGPRLSWHPVMEGDTHVQAWLCPPR